MGFRIRTMVEGENNQRFVSGITRCLIKNFSIFLHDVVGIVKNLISPGFKSPQLAAIKVS